MRLEDCLIQAPYDGVFIAESPCDIELYRCQFSSNSNTSQMTARLLQIACPTARCRCHAFDCSFFGFTGAASPAVADPIVVTGANTDLHLINSSILSAATGSGATAVDITASASSGAPNVVVSNSTPFDPTNVAGTIRFAPTPFDGADLIETGLTLQQALRLISAFSAGKLSGVGSGTEIYRNAVANTKDRMVVTVDAQGNRTDIDYELT